MSAPPQNPMSSAEPWTLVAEGYVTDTLPLFRQYCEKAIELSGLLANEKILDVACGPGTLSLLAHAQAAEIHAIDFSPGMLQCFEREIAAQSIANIKTYHMDGQALSFEDHTFDRAFSIFGLMFFPDRSKGFAELYRTLRPGGTAVVTSWAPLGESTGMSLMFGAIQAAFPRKPSADGEKILNLEDPENFKAEMSAAGFRNVTITPHIGDWPVVTHEECLDSMVRGSAPIAMIKRQLSDEVWAEKRAIMLAYMQNALPELPTTLNAKAYIGVGRK